MAMLRCVHLLPTARQLWLAFGGHPLQAAPFLREVMQQEEGSGTAPQLSAEQFTLAKEQKKRARGAEVITAEGSYQVSEYVNTMRHAGDVPAGVLCVAPRQPVLF